MNLKLTCYIIDDEPLAIEVLESHIKKVDKLEIAGRYQNAVEAFQGLQENPVDLLFLDIRMPGLSGIEFIKTLKNPPKVIFTTAYREYALDGFELDVVDYLLKPISFERFLKALDKVFEGHPKTAAPGAAANNRGRGSEKFLFVQSDQKKVKIAPDQILHIESRGDNIKITTESKEIFARQTLSHLEEKLAPHGFIRIHRSFIVPVDRIESWSASEIEVSGKTLPIGRTYKKQVIELLEARSDII